MADIISFNAPGIAGMPIVESAFSEGMVISMRAHYDAVSALGKPYGFVINNQVPEGNDDASLAFGVENVLTHETNLQKIICAELEVCSVIGREVQVRQSGAVFKQHLMGNFMGLILKQSDAIAIPFTSLREWAQNHGGLNHNFNGPCMYSESEAAMAA